MEKTMLYKSFLCWVFQASFEFQSGKTVSFSRVRPASADIDQNSAFCPFFSSRSRASVFRWRGKNSALCNKPYSFRPFSLRTALESRFWTGNQSGWLHFC